MDYGEEYTRRLHESGANGIDFLKTPQGRVAIARARRQLQISNIERTHGEYDPSKHNKYMARDDQYREFNSSIIAHIEMASTLVNCLSTPEEAAELAAETIELQGSYEADRECESFQNLTDRLVYRAHELVGWHNFGLLSRIFGEKTCMTFDKLQQIVNKVKSTQHKSNGVYA